MTAALILFIVFLMIFHNTDFGRYIMLQITTLADEVLGTSYAAHYGASKEALGSSANYREQLKYIFTLDWLNPLLGIGRKDLFLLSLTVPLSCLLTIFILRNISGMRIPD